MHTQLVRVLLVEDDEDDYFLTRDVIESIDRADYQIVWCDTFDKAFDALMGQSFDVALIDYRIGAKTGIEFVQKAKAVGFDVPMILLTGLQDQEIEIAASEAGASDYLNKGELAPAVVERAIRFACSNAATQRSLAERSGLLQTTIDNIGAGLAALDNEGKLIAHNKRFGDLVCLPVIRRFAGRQQAEQETCRGSVGLNPVIAHLAAEIEPHELPARAGDESARRVGLAQAIHGETGREVREALGEAVIQPALAEHAMPKLVIVEKAGYR